MALIDLTEGDEPTEPAEAPIIEYSIIAIHGLYETGIAAWRDEATKKVWLRDLFPYRLYRARMLSYEYDAKTLMAPGGSAVTGIYDESVTLVSELVADRTMQKATRRPIIFVCHGFGGILVKRALAFSNSRKSPKLDHLRSIVRSTFALLFMGTPHNGLTKNSLRFAQWGNYSGPSSFMLSLLEGSGSEVLQEVTDQFAPLMKLFSIYNFWEHYETDFGRERTIIVDRVSAAPPSWSDVDKCGIYATHSGMTKFTSTKSPGYRLVLATLDHHISAAADAISKRWQQDSEVMRQERMHEAVLLRAADLQTDSGPSLGCVGSEPSTTPPVLKPLHLRSEIPPEEVLSPYVNVHYLVSQQSEHFVGRQEQANQLNARLGTKKRRKPQVFVIYGLAGSGKTQFCLKYLEDNRHRYWGVFWIDCSSEANAEDSFAAISLQAGKGEAASAGLAWLSQTFEPWLLVLDNTNDHQMDLSRFVPVAGNGNILVTSRNPTAQIYSTIGHFQFTGMDPEEAITLLLRLAYPEGQTQYKMRSYRQPAEVIASELGYLPLALKQAAITIRQGMWPLDRYVKSLLGCRKALLGHPAILSTATANITATWELPFVEITKDTTQHYRDAVDLVHVFALMHFASIPVKIFPRSSDGIKQSNFLKVRPLSICEPDSSQDVEDRILMAAKILYDHSIISITEVKPVSEDSITKGTSTHHFSLHPAIHHWARERLDEDRQREWADCVASILAHSISSNLETSGRNFRRLLLPHIRACLAVLQTTYRELPQTLEQACDIEKFGLVYAENGLWKDARSLQSMVVNFRAHRLGTRHVDTLHAQRSLASSFWNLFELEKCLTIQRDVLMANWWSRPSIYDWIIWPPWKPVHVHYCTALDDLTRSLWLAGRRDLSQRAGERAMHGLVHNLGQDDPLTLTAMFNLARTYLHIGEHKRSYELLLIVLEKRMHFFGPDHPETLMAKNELGMNLCAQRVQLDEAERLVLGALHSRKRVLGEEHAYTLWSVNDLSKIYCELGRFDEAANILEEIIPVVKRTLGKNHVGMIMTKSNLTRAYILCERWTEAGDIIDELRGIVPREHPDWVHVNWGHALILVHKGQLDEAEKVCTELLTEVSTTKVLGPDNPRVIAIAEILLKVYKMQKREADIAELKEKFPRVEDDEILNSIDHMPLGKLRHRVRNS